VLLKHKCPVIPSLYAVIFVLLAILAVESLLFLSHLVLALSLPVVHVFVLFWNLPIEQKSTLFLVFSMFSELYYAAVEKRQISALGYGGLLVTGLSLVLVYFVAVLFAFGLAMGYCLKVLRWTESFSNSTIRKLMELLFITTGSILCLAVESIIVGNERRTNKLESEVDGAGVDIEEDRWRTLLKWRLKWFPRAAMAGFTVGVYVFVFAHRVARWQEEILERQKEVL
jgi:hypothetical protein